MEALLPILWSFASLDRATGETRAGAALETVASSGISDYDGSTPYVYSGRLDLFGELALDECRRWGVVANLPLTFVYVRYESSELSYSQAGLGALSLGGYYNADLGATSLRARLDVVLPTDHFQGDRDPHFLRAAAMWHRIAEPTDDRGATWLRAAGIARYQRGPWLLQGEVFVKLALDEQLEDEFLYDESQVPLGGLGLGLGRELGRLHATAELVVAELPLADEEKLRDWDALTNEMMATATLSLGGRQRNVQWRVHAGAPLDSYHRDHTVILGADLLRRF